MTNIVNTVDAFWSAVREPLRSLRAKAVVIGWDLQIIGGMNVQGWKPDDTGIVLVTPAGRMVFKIEGKNESAAVQQASAYIDQAGWPFGQ